jgi:hypothetical protein
VLNRTFSPSVSIHTGVTCGVPSGMTVATLAICGSRSSATSSVLNFLVMPVTNWTRS